MSGGAKYIRRGTEKILSYLHNKYNTKEWFMELAMDYF